MKTYSAKPSEIERRWYVVDASDQVLGRLSTRIATVLRGKHKATFTPHIDTGDFVIVVNAEKVKLTGAKLEKKMYRRHSGYPGGLKELWYGKLLETHPERAIERAVKGMLPKGTLGRQQLRKLKVYAGPNHPHGAQKPELLVITNVGVESGGPEPVTQPAKAPPAKAEPAKAKAPAEAPKAAAPAPGETAPEPVEAAPEPVEATSEAPAEEPTAAEAPAEDTSDAPVAEEETSG
jgi:large subunit ribosomal protein L13